MLLSVNKGKDDRSLELEGAIARKRPLGDGINREEERRDGKSSGPHCLCPWIQPCLKPPCKNFSVHGSQCLSQPEFGSLSLVSKSLDSDPNARPPCLHMVRIAT